MNAPEKVLVPLRVIQQVLTAMEAAEIELGKVVSKESLSAYTKVAVESERLRCYVQMEIDAMQEAA